MGFRDDGEAARARADALERQNRELRQQLAGRVPDGGADGNAAPAQTLGGRLGALLVVAGVGVAVTGVVLVGAFGAPVLLLPVLFAVGGILITLRLVASLVLVALPNELIVLSGRPRRLLDGRVVGYRVVCGGSAVRLPILERADRLDLTNIALALALQGLHTMGGATVSLKAAANVKVAGTEPELHNAVERFLGRGRDEIAVVAREIVEGAIRGVAAVVTVEDIRTDPERVAHQVLLQAGDDLRRVGLVLDTFKIKIVPGASTSSRAS